MSTAAQLHQEQKTKVLTIPLTFQSTLPLLEANQGSHVILPASCSSHCSSGFVGVVKCLWPSGALSVLAGHCQAPTAPAGSATSPTLPCSGLFAWCSWCFSAVLPEDPAQLKRDMRYLLLCSSLPLPALPFLSVVSTSLQRLGKTSDVFRLVCSLFIKSPCVSCQMDRKGLLPLPMVCCTLLPSGQPSTRHPLLLSLPSSSHYIYLNPIQLLLLQPLETWGSRVILGLPV